ncbi:MAG: hypothetical protein ACREJC_05200 [Tepidisphaeraceae bacterium]
MEPRPTRSVAWIYLIALALSLAALGGGIWLAAKQNIWVGVGVGIGAVLAVLVTWPIAMILSALPRMMPRALEEKLNPIREAIDHMSVLLNLMSEQQLLTERTKSIAFREKERETLRRAIQEEISKQDWEAAMVLANAIEGSFGYRSEADRFRTEINQRRTEIVRRLINDAIAGIDRHMRSENWNVAIREAERLMQIYPADEQVQRLPLDIEHRRQEHKRQLLEAWRESVNRKDVDGSIEILKKLDLYLTPAEGESIQETARSIFKEKINNLRTVFSMAVQDHNWTEAVRVGDEIMRDFPNSQMAREVREMMDTLKQRSTEEVARV